MSVYLLHFTQAVAGHASHYLGYADDVAPRVYAHQHGHGARLTQVAVERGAALVLARTWPDGDRRLERRLKRRKASPRLCPICRGDVGLQLGLLPGVETFIPCIDADDADLVSA